MMPALGAKLSFSNADLLLVPYETKGWQ